MDGEVSQRFSEQERRISVLERDAARDGQRLSELERRVDSLTPLLTSVVQLTVEFQNMRADLAGFMQRVDARDADREKERSVAKRWLIGLAIALAAALITATATILSQHS